MITDTLMVIYLMAYIVSIIGLVVLGCTMLWYQGKSIVTHGEQVAKQRLTRTMGVSMLLIAFQSLLYLPPMLMGYPGDHLVYKIFFLLTLMLSVPMGYHMMMAVVQRQFRSLRLTSALALPYVVLIGWQLMFWSDASDNMLLYIGAALAALSFIGLLVKFAGEYRIYLRRLQSAYSETTDREIFWSWICFGGFAVQGLLFVAYQLMWSPWLDALYLVVSLPNVVFLCFCTCRQRTLDLDVVPESEPEAEIEDPKDEKAFYADIEERLQTLCEDKLLFLDPELTRETLCLRLAINRTYLSMYFHQRGTSYYQYINTLRIEYAVRLMQENPQLSIGEVASQSGFRSQPTFRKAFQVVMGCLPSEIKK